MNNVTRPTNANLTMQDLHRAIETLAVNQAEIGLNVLWLLNARLIEDEEARMLYDRTSRAVNELQALADRFLDMPFDD